jgi:hypothetical protein
LQWFAPIFRILPKIFDLEGFVAYLSVAQDRHLHTQTDFMAKRKLQTARKKPLDGRANLRMSEAELNGYLEAANRQGLSLSHWLRLAARMVLKNNQGKVELVRLDD